jgi:hypothetical protein
MIKNNVLIIGCTISSLYTAIKCIDLGYNVKIVDKNNRIEISDYLYDNCIFFNSNHKKYINLLKRFNINYNSRDIILNEKIIKIIKTVIDKSKYIPNNILQSYSFIELSSQILNKNDIAELYNYEIIFNNINSKECIDMFSNDLNNIHTFYNIKKSDIVLLINRMIKYLTDNNCEILYNVKIKNINYIGNIFKLNTDNLNSSILYTDIVIATISKKNLLLFNFWNGEQISLLNSTYSVNILEIKKFIDYLIIHNSHESNIRENILRNIHVVYPLFNKYKNFYFWKKGKNSVLIMEKIRNMYNRNFFICSESYSKNSLFINYSLEYIDKSISKFQKKNNKLLT